MVKHKYMPKLLQNITHSLHNQIDKGKPAECVVLYQDFYKDIENSRLSGFDPLSGFIQYWKKLGLQVVVAPLGEKTLIKLEILDDTK